MGVSDILMFIAMGITFFVLLAGILSMAIGGEFNKKYGNKLMRARVVAQAVAVVMFAIAFAI